MHAPCRQKACMGAASVARRRRCACSMHCMATEGGRKQNTAAVVVAAAETPNIRIPVSGHFFYAHPIQTDAELLMLRPEVEAMPLTTKAAHRVFPDVPFLLVGPSVSTLLLTAAIGTSAPFRQHSSSFFRLRLAGRASIRIRTRTYDTHRSQLSFYCTFSLRLFCLVSFVVITQIRYNSYLVRM